MTILFISFAIFLLIIDPQGALMGAREGVDLCIQTVIPSLLPFFFLSVVLTNRLSGRKIPMLNALGRLLRLPEGAEAIFIIGILGGYPVGAQAIAQTTQMGQLDHKSAGRMLGFCSNAGPSFIFGILGGLFSAPCATWALWLIHIISAILVGISLPGNCQSTVAGSQNNRITPPEALERAVKIMASVCGWVILFRVMISFLSRWVLWLCPQVLQTIIVGSLELTNGCCALTDIENEGLRFILASCFLAFGGSCVAMQTMAVTRSIGTGQYFPGKIMQTMISFLLSLCYQALFFPDSLKTSFRPIIWCPVLIVLLVVLSYLQKPKNNSSIPQLSGV